MKRVVVIGAVSPELLAPLNGAHITRQSAYGAEMVGDVRNEDGLLSRLQDADLILFSLNVGGAHPTDYRHGAMLFRALKQQNGSRVLVEGRARRIRIGVSEVVTIRDTDVLTPNNLKGALA